MRYRPKPRLGCDPELDKIAKTTGPGSIDQKVKLLAGLLAPVKSSGPTMNGS